MRHEVIFKVVLNDQSGGAHAYFGPFANVEAAKNKFMDGVRDGTFVVGSFQPRFINAPETTKWRDIVEAAAIPQVV